MTQLQVCQECHRHIRVGEPACPFCGTTASPSATRGPVRAALFAGAIVGASAFGCGDAKPVVEDPADKGGPVQVGQSDAMPASPVDTDVDDDSYVEPDRPPADPDMPPMPYGAPPARKRLV